MLDNLIISSEGVPQCKTHKKNLTAARTSGSFLKGSFPLAICPQCNSPAFVSQVQASFRGYVNSGTCSISFNGLAEHPSIELSKSKALQNFRSSQIEHILVNKDSKGYGPGSLVYIPERNLLAVCESDKKVGLWSVGEKNCFWRIDWSGGRNKICEIFQHL